MFSLVKLNSNITTVSNIKSMVNRQVAIKMPGDSPSATQVLLSEHRSTAPSSQKVLLPLKVHGRELGKYRSEHPNHLSMIAAEAPYYAFIEGVQQQKTIVTLQLPHQRIFLKVETCIINKWIYGP